VTDAERPALTADLTAEEFSRWYWLREELAAFCRAERLPRSGSKADLAAVVAARLGGPPAPTGRRAVTVPDEQPLGLAALVPDAVRCDQRLRAFFEQHVGPRFRFTVPFQRWLHANPGRPYADAVVAWHQLAAQGPRPVEAQFEHNAFTRAHRLEHPDCTAAEVRAAWWRHRSQPHPPSEQQARTATRSATRGAGAGG
jgi:hypothetical protein